MNVVVLAGGLSMERDVSLASGSLIANALRDAGHKAVLVDLYYGIDKQKMSFDDTSERYEHKISEIAPDLNALIKMRLFNTPHILLTHSTASGSSKVILPSLPLRYSSSNTLAIRSVFTSARAIR